MKKENRLIKIVAVLLIILIIGLTFDKFKAFSTFGWSIVSPFAIGGLLAIIINIPMRFFEQKVFKWETQSLQKIKRPLAILLSILIIIAIVTGLSVFIVPQITATFSEITKSVPLFIRNNVDNIKTKFEPTGAINAELSSLSAAAESWGTLVVYITNNTSINLPNSINFAYGFVSNAFSSFAAFLISFVVALYSLSKKEVLISAGKKCLNAFLSVEKKEYWLNVFKLIQINLENFFFGSCLECITIAFIFAILAAIFKFKCAVIIGVIMMFLALIPYIGNLISCSIGVLLTLAMESPERAFWFVILFAIVQALDGYLIYPKIIGSKISVPPFLIFCFAILGNSLFGVLGMIVAIPFMSTIYMLVKEKVETLNSTRDLIAHEDN